MFFMPKIGSKMAWAFTFNVYDAVAMSYLMKNVGRSSAKESDWTNSKLATDGQTHIHLPAPVYCPDVGGQLNHPPPNCAHVQWHDDD